MSQGGYATIVGFVAQDPSIRTTPTGKVLTKVRVGATPRYKDASGHWRDAQTSYFDVACWGRLAHHVRNSLHKGEPVVLKGRFRTSTFEDKNGNMRNSIEITADTVGHDLNRGPATYLRPQMQRMTPDNDRHYGPEGPGAEALGRPGDIDAGGGDGYDDETGDIMDDEAIDRLGRELDEADLAVRTLRDGDGAAQAGGGAAYSNGASSNRAGSNGAGTDEAGTDEAGRDKMRAGDAADDPVVGPVPPVPATSY